MTERRRYTARERAKAVGIATVDGVTAAERTTGIPKETIQYWTTKPEYAQLRTTAREVVVEQLWIGVQVGIEELTKGLRSDAPVHQKAQAFEALAERYSLLNGEPTHRSETRTVTDGLSDHEKAALRAVIDQAIAETVA
jgi:hypothetical protein